MRWMEVDIILGKEFEGVILEIGKPGVLFAAQPRIDAHLVLITLPGNAMILQPFGKSCPLQGPIIHIVIPDQRPRILVLLRPDRSRPEIEPVWVGARQRRTKILIANRECIG